MPNLNRVIIVGNLGHDPELRHTDGGKSMLTLSLATTDHYESEGRKKERTDWHRVVVWNRLAEACATYLKKGASTLVEGRLQSRKYEKNGEERHITEIVATNVQFLNGRKGSSAQNAETAEEEGNVDEAAPADEDIPF